MKKLTEGQKEAMRYAKSAWDLGIVNILISAPKVEILDIAELETAEIKLTGTEKIKVYYFAHYALRGVQIFVTNNGWFTKNAEITRYINYGRNCVEEYDRTAQNYLSYMTNTTEQKELARILVKAFIGETIAFAVQNKHIDYTEKNGGIKVTNFRADRALYTPWKCGLTPRAHTLAGARRNTPSRIMNGEAVRRED